MHDAVARECRRRAHRGRHVRWLDARQDRGRRAGCRGLPRTACMSTPGRKLGVGRCRYGILLREDGFVLDDGVVGRLAADRFHVTTTTGGAARVLAMMEDYLQTEWPDLDVWLTSVTEQWAVIAVQGPRARDVLAPLVEGIDISRRRSRTWRWRAARSAACRRGCSASASPANSDSRSTCRPITAARCGRRSGSRRAARHHALRHRGDACAARRKGLHHRRAGDRRHGDARRCRPRLGDRRSQAGFRRQAVPGARRAWQRPAASNWSGC